MRVLLVALALGASSAFVATSPPTKTTALGAYVPSGMTAEQYKKLKDKENADKKKKNFGLGGARGFESRSMNSFVKDLEAGKAKHLMPRGGSWKNTDLTKGKKGWMTTGFGMTAFNDGKAKEVKANKYDAQYNGKKPSVSIWGDGGSLDWTGRGARGTGGDTVGARATRNGISNDQQMWRDAGALGKKDIAKMAKRGSQANINKPEKKFFGLF
ncbi:hypothetical protein JL721_5094 [Aureococcus anophagefferens]|nr:hypothetical protein JL721_5094 [Aureococcus anophagefferens]